MEERSKRFSKAANDQFGRAQGAVSGFGSKLKEASGYLKGMVAIVSVSSLLALGGQAVVNYEASLASLSAVTGLTGDKLSQLDAQVQETARRTKKSAVEVAAGFEIVGSAMSQYLDDPKALGQITDAGILLSKASKMALEPSLKSLTGAMNQFNMGAEQAAKTVDILTAGEIVGQVSTEKSVDALAKFGAVANSMNTTLPESVALIQVLGKKLPTEDIGTAARNLLLFMDTSKGASKEALDAFTRNGVSLEVLSDKTLTTADRLRELSKIQGDSVAMSKIFGKENITAGKVIFDQLGTYEKWVTEIGKTEKAQEQAAANTSAIKSRVGELKAAYENAVISSANGSIGMKMFNAVLKVLADNMGTIIGLIAGLAAVIIPIYAAYKLAALVTTLWDVALAANALLTNAGAMSLRRNLVALRAYNTMSKVATALQWAWNAALTANPIGLIVAAIVAIIAIIVLLVKHWDTLKAKFQAAPTWVKIAIAPFLAAMAPLLILVNAIRKVVDAWGGIKNAFSEGGFLDGIKKLGGVILSALIDPLIFLLKLLAKIPGVSKAVDPLVSQYEAFQAKAEGGFGVDAQLAANREPINTEATQNKTQTEIIKESRQTLDINVNDPNNRLGVTQNGLQPIPIKVNRTSGWGR